MHRIENVKLQNTVEEIQEYSTKKKNWKKSLGKNEKGLLSTTGTPFNLELDRS
jgi:hypothetical protein